ncbi:MAG: glycosyltransferase family 2 protein [Leptolyngbya sp. IPPAS B-1204]|nr:MAG: glycosyltransferase [Leptolyngbya sp. IPPAS B-1204]
MPIISVVIPAYNAEQTILETLASVQNQTFSDIEIIVINDGSTDRTLELVQSVNDSRIKIFSDQNGGLPVARNRGISYAIGELITFIDADDLWTPDKLELQLKVLQQHPEASVAYSWSCLIGQEGSLLARYHPIYFQGDVYHQLLLNNFIANGSNILVYKEAAESIGGFDSTLKSVEDWDFYLRLAAKYQFVVVPEWQILYRQSPNAMTSKVEVMEAEALKVIEKAYRNAPLQYHSLKNRSLAWIHQYCTQQYLKNSTDLRGVQMAAHKLLTAVRFYPPILLDAYTRNLVKWLIKRWIILMIH